MHQIIELKINFSILNFIIVNSTKIKYNGPLHRRRKKNNPIVDSLFFLFFSCARFRPLHSSSRHGERTKLFIQQVDIQNINFMNFTPIITHIIAIN